MELEFRHDLDCDGPTYFEHCIYNDAFWQRVYGEVLKFPKFETLEMKTEGDVMIRKVFIEPPVTGLPGPAKKVIGDRMSYVELGTYDKKTGKYSFDVTPSVFPTKVKTRGVMWCEPRGEKKSTRIAKITVEVKIFAVGGTIEDKISNDLRQSYDATAAFTNRWIKEKGL
jgi:hypothetical protein